MPRADSAVSGAVEANMHDVPLSPLQFDPSAACGKGDARAVEPVEVDVAGRGEDDAREALALGGVDLPGKKVAWLMRDADVPVGDAASDDFERGRDIGSRPDDIGDPGLFDGQIPVEDQGDLGLDLGCMVRLAGIAIPSGMAMSANSIPKSG